MTMTMKAFNSFGQGREANRQSHETVWEHKDYKVLLPLPNTLDSHEYHSIHVPDKPSPADKNARTAQRIERNMTAILQKSRKIGLCISRRIRMSLATKLFESQSGFVFRTCCCVMNIFTDIWKRFPHGKSLESKNNFHTGTLPPYFYSAGPEQIFFHNITGRRNFCYIGKYIFINLYLLF